MRLEGVLDCLVPRGGASLIASVRENATVPTVIDGDGNCHIYVDREADLDMALAVVVQRKDLAARSVQRSRVAARASDVAADVLAEDLAQAMPEVELVGDERTLAVIDAGPADEDDYASEFLSLKMSVAVVDDVQGAIDHIARFGSGHSEAIVTRNLVTAEKFVRQVDAAAVLVNASTRFVDGGELGLGAEIGISTQKLHARGPMGLEALTCVKYVIVGDGHVR